MKKTVSNLNLEMFSIARRYCTNASKKPHICQNDPFWWSLNISWEVAEFRVISYFTIHI